MKMKWSSPWIFIVLMGVVSLFADMTYEGARSITGPFLGTLGASATIVGFVAGFGELMGYAVRLFSGVLADSTRKYWALTFIGYFTNLLAVPALALAGNWQIAALLIILERTGKAVRNPPRDVMLSHATSTIGYGKGFGIHEALDQIGAVTGPLIVGAVFYFSGKYSDSFAILLIPALLALSILVVSRIQYPDTGKFEKAAVESDFASLKKYYWLYLAAMALIAAGYADFPLIAYHFTKTGQVPLHWIPVMYAVAMGVAALAALVLGKYFDRYGRKTMIYSTLVALLFAPLVFTGNIYTALAGMTCWGIGMGAQGSIVKAILATMLHKNKRGTGFGVFNATFGVFWFLGSFLMGWLYDVSIIWLIIFSVGIQIASLPLLIKISGKRL
ncbi:MAG TPA: MFS transporter [Spirochaetota bacterium]